MKLYVSVLALLHWSLIEANPVVPVNVEGQLGPRAAPSSTCTTALVTPTPAAFHCEQFGTLARPKPLQPASSIQKGVRTPFIACRNSCLDNSKCISFGYTSSSRACTQYGVTLESMGFKESTKSTPSKFANRRCYKRTCSSSTPTPSPTPTPTPTPPASVHTPTPTPADLLNPSFENTQPDGTSPPWQTGGSVFFVNDPDDATDGVYYADMSTSSAQAGGSQISQTVNGLNTSQFYLLNFTVTVDQNVDTCYLSAFMQIPNYSRFFFRYFFDANTPPGPLNFYGTAQPPSQSSPLYIGITCYDDNSGNHPTFRMYVDDLKLVQPDLSGLMYLQVDDPTNSTGFSNAYLQASTYTYNPGVTVFTSDITQATQYALDPYGRVFFTSGPGYDFAFWNQDTSAQADQTGIAPVEYDRLSSNHNNNYANRVPPPYADVICSITPGTTLYLSCSSWGSSFLSAYNDGLALGDQAASEAQGAVPLALKVVYVADATQN